MVTITHHHMETERKCEVCGLEGAFSTGKPGQRPNESPAYKREIGPQHEAQRQVDREKAKQLALVILVSGRVLKPNVCHLVSKR